MFEGFRKASKDFKRFRGTLVGLRQDPGVLNSFKGFPVGFRGVFGKF